MNYKDEATKGFFLAIGAFVIWGAFPIFFKLFDGVSAWEILIHRIIWSVACMAIFFYFASGFNQIKMLILNKKTRNLLFLSGLMISLNWLIYVYAVSNSRILEASLGYFMNPLVNIFIGFLVFKEQITPCGKAGIFIVFLAVLTQIYGVGDLPFISLMLPLSFAIYIGIRKFIKVAAMQGLFIETLLVFPISMAYFIYLFIVGENHFKADFNGFLMICSGVVTIIPLVMFNAATTRMKLTTLAYIQYLSPTLSMLVAVVIFDEKLEVYKLISFCLIWLAIAIISIESAINLRKDKR